MLRREFLIGTLALTAFPTSGFAFPDALIVNRTETCGCCGAWVERMTSAGLRTEVNFVDEKELALIKTQLAQAAVSLLAQTWYRLVSHFHFMAMDFVFIYFIPKENTIFTPFIFKHNNIP